MANLERIKSSPLLDAENSSITDIDVISNYSGASVKRAKDDNYLTGLNQKRTISQPANAPGYSPQKNNSKTRKGRRNTLGHYDFSLSPQQSVGSSKNIGTLYEENNKKVDTLFFDDNLKDLIYAPLAPSESNESYLPVPSGNQRESFFNATSSNLNISDSEYPREADKVPTIRPGINYQDKLWTQIDVLDDVKRMSDDAIKNRSFFTSSYETNFRNLQQSQKNLLNSIKKVEKRLDTDYNRDVWFEFDIDLDKLENLKHLYNKDHFDVVKNGIEEVRKEVMAVSELMKKEEFKEELSSNNDTLSWKDSDSMNSNNTTKQHMPQ